MFNQLDIITPIQLKSVDGLKGRFYTTPNGDKYPSITTILGQKEKPGLVDWRMSLGAPAANKEMNRAADRGTAVHLMTERYLNNDTNPTKDQRIEHIVEFNSLKVLLRGIDNIITQETALYSDELKVAGRVDCIGEYKGNLCIIDFKTSTNDKKQSLIEDYFLQTTAYALMFEEQYGIMISDVVILMSVEKGVPMVFRGKVDDYIAPLLNRINTFYTTS
jgi:genome maintenance exonuclease 1